MQQVRNIHYTMAKPWDLRHPCHKGYEQLNELWWAAFSEPRTLCRMLLKLRMHEKRAKEQRGQHPSESPVNAQPAAPAALSLSECLSRAPVQSQVSK